MKTLKLSSELNNDLKANFIKTINVIEFLISEGFKTSKPVNDTALKDLDYNGKKIKKASFNNGNIILKF